MTKKEKQPHFLFILNELVDSVVSPRNHEVSEKEWLVRHHLLEAAVKFLDALLKKLVEPVSVLSTDQSVLEHTAALVVPQLQQLDLILRDPHTELHSYTV